MYSLTSTKSWHVDELQDLLARADWYQANPVTRPVHGTVATVFAEPSTRTSLSFQIAAQKLGLNVLNFSAENSSFRKGESLQDTLETLAAMGVDITVLRTTENWPTQVDASLFNMGLVNAGSGINEHPTQALLDALTIKQHFGTLRGLTVTIVGDVLHSRVARSNVDVLTKLGAKVQFAGPPEFNRDDISLLAPWTDFAQAVAESDVVMMLRIQYERHQQSLAMTEKDYHEQYGLTLSRAAKLRSDAIILHPGPVNRGVEIAGDIVHHPQSRILQQVTNGVAVRMAVLEYCLVGGCNAQLVSA